MDKQHKPKHPPLSDLERWRNLCDAMSEDLLLDPPSAFGRSGDAFSLQMELAHLARPGETPEQQIARLRLELERLLRRPMKKVNFKQAARDRKEEVLQRKKKIRELQKAAGLAIPDPEMELRRAAIKERRAAKKRDTPSGQQVPAEHRKKQRNIEKKKPLF
jgi:hypothetical protein